MLKSKLSVLFTYIIVGYCLTGCATSSTTTATSKVQPTVETTESIGTARMSNDGNIVLTLVSTSDGRGAHGQFTYTTDHPQYQSIFKHVQPIQPGQQVSVKPWPE